MDVTCERCGTEYEFDETLVSDRGTTVKCTNCGHLFKVFRPASDGAAPKSWTVRSADGQVRTLTSLKELQRLITDGVLNERDLIARGDEPEKHLGDIAELATFFAAASAAVADTHVDSARKRVPTAPMGDRRRVSPNAKTVEATAVDATAPSARPQPPPSRRGKKQTMIGMGGASDVPPPARPPSPPARPRTPPRPPSRPASPRTAPDGLRPSPADATAPATPAARQAPRPPSRPAPSSAPSMPAAPPAPSSAPPREPPSRPAPPDSQPRSEQRGLYLDAQEPAAPARGKSRSGLWVMLTLLLAAGVGVALGWPQIAPLLGLAPEAENPAAPHLEAGDEALAGDTIAGYEGAISRYTQALAYDDHDVATLTRLSRAQALWAQALETDASDLEANAGDAGAEGNGARLGEANALRRDAARKASTALQRAEDAVRHGSNDAQAELALADAQRLTGDLEAARRHLDRALTLDSTSGAEGLRVQALIEAAEHEGDLSHARTGAESAVAEDPSMIRARLLFARAALAANEVSTASAQVDAVLRRVEDHPRALALRTAIDEGRPPAPPTVDVPDGGELDAGPVEGEGEGEPEPEGTTTAPAASDRGGRGGGGSGAIPRGRDYSYYVHQGEEALERGQTDRARDLYQTAHDLRPGGSEALSGLGFVALSAGDASGAANRFRQAAGQGYADAYIGLGSAYRRMGRNRDALTAYERYLERLPNGPRASIARRQAEQLRALVANGSGGGGEAGGGGAGGASGQGTNAPVGATPEPEGGTPATPEGSLPAPNGTTEPPPQDTPAIESAP